MKAEASFRFLDGRHAAINDLSRNDVTVSQARVNQEQTVFFRFGSLQTE